MGRKIVLPNMGKLLLKLTSNKLKKWDRGLNWMHPAGLGQKN